LNLVDGVDSRGQQRKEKVAFGLDVVFFKLIIMFLICWLYVLSEKKIALKITQTENLKPVSLIVCRICQIGNT